MSGRLFLAELQATLTARKGVKDMEQETGSLVWRGDADFYRRRLREAFTYEVVLEMTCHSYVMALATNPLCDMRSHAAYLSTVFSGVSVAKARGDMSELIGDWLDEGIVTIPDEIRMMADEGQITLPFPVRTASAAMCPTVSR